MIVKKHHNWGGFCSPFQTAPWPRAIETILRSSSWNSYGSMGCFPISMGYHNPQMRNCIRCFWVPNYSPFTITEKWLVITIQHKFTKNYLSTSWWPLPSPTPCGLFGMTSVQHGTHLGVLRQILSLWDFLKNGGFNGGLMVGEWWFNGIWRDSMRFISWKIHGT